MKSINIQDSVFFESDFRKENTFVTVFLLESISAARQLKGFDNFQC